MRNEVIKMYYDNSEENQLYHFGIKGMKWGVRRTPQQLGHDEPSRKTRREAEKDAKEYARAKMFYGEGAGTRRKLINATVKSKSKDPMYKKAFDDALSRQDMSRHAEKARSERRRKDVANTTKKTARGIVNIATGNAARVGAGLAAAYGLYQIGKATGLNSKIANFAKNTSYSAINFLKAEKGKRFARKFASRIVVMDD